MNPDFRDILSIFNEENVEFLVVGAYALAAHGLPRATGDIDLFIRPSAENARRVWRSLLRFGAPLLNLKLEDLEQPDIGFQMGVPPNRIDLLTSIEAVNFDEAWPARMQTDVYGVPVGILSREHLLQNKKATGRPKDQADAAWLEGEARH
ncbi:MAG TPA: hypothetical protein VML55_24510 [Planctomycetaceae bacterium]|nr:hypothetical protein [Planctomycetaceae bacterium]